MPSTLSGSHQKTYDRIFEHPLAHNLQWRELSAMFSALPNTDAVEDDKGVLNIVRNGHAIKLHRPKGKDLADNDELMQVRRFLEASGEALPTPAADATHLLVVIDHREARVYSAELHGTIPHRIVPYDPFGYGRELHYKQDDSNGQRKPEQRSFYDAVAKTLQGASQILLFGCGTGASSAMEQLLTNLKQHHSNLSSRVVGSFSIDEHHLTEDQLLAKARELFVTN